MGVFDHGDYLLLMTLQCDIDHILRRGDFLCSRDADHTALELRRADGTRSSVPQKASRSATILPTPPAGRTSAIAASEWVNEAGSVERENEENLEEREGEHAQDQPTIGAALTRFRGSA